MNAVLQHPTPLLDGAPEAQRVRLEPGGRLTLDGSLVEVASGSVDCFLALRPSPEVWTGPPGFLGVRGPGDLLHAGAGGPAILQIVATQPTQLWLADAERGWDALERAPSPRRDVAMERLASWSCLLAGSVPAVAHPAACPYPGLIGADRLFAAVGLAAAQADLQRTAERLAYAESRQAADAASLAAAVARLSRCAAGPRPGVEAPPALAGAAAMLEGLGVACDTLPVLEAGEDPVAAAARFLTQQGARWRNVMLKPGWTRGGEALVAFRESGSVALLPRLGGGYTVVDWAGAAPRQLCAREAGMLRPRALAVQAPLTGNGWTARGLVAHGLRAAHPPVWQFMALLGGSGLVSTAVPVAMGRVMDPIIPSADAHALGVLAAVLVLAAMAGVLLSAAQSILLLRLEGMLDNRVQAAIWDRLMRLPPSFFRRFGVGDLMARANAVNEMRQLMSSAAVASLVHSVSGLVSVVVMVATGGWLAGIVILLVLSYAACSILLGRRAIAWARVGARLEGEQRSFLLQIVSGIGRIRLSGAQRRVFARWATRQAGVMEASLAQRRHAAAGRVLGRAMAPLCLVALLIVLGLQAGALSAPFDTPQGWADLQSDGLAHAIAPAGFVAFSAAMGQLVAAAAGVAEAPAVTVIVTVFWA